MGIQRHVGVLSAVVLLVVLTAEATASILMFTHAGSGSGTLAGIPFPESDFVITATVDTDNRVSFPNGFVTPHTSANISITGLGTFDFVTPTQTFVNNNVQGVGFSNSATRLDLFDGPIDPQFGTWDMLSPIGPITGPGDVFATWDLPLEPPVETTGGDLVFIRGTPTATFTAIPEPATLSLLALGGLLATRRRR